MGIQEEEVKLFGMWASPFSRRVEFALKLKGIRYEYIEEDLSNKSPSLLKYNPIHKKIPVFVHNGKGIPESLAILEYIDDTWRQNPILPQDPYQRALARLWAKFIDDKLFHAACRAYTTSKENGGDEVIEEAREHLKSLENELKGKKFFGGDSIGYLDIVAGIIALWFPIIQEVTGVELLNEEEFPILHKWILKIRDFSTFKECLPPREQHISYLKARCQAAKVSKSK